MNTVGYKSAYALPAGTTNVVRDRMTSGRALLPNRAARRRAVRHVHGLGSGSQAVTQLASKGAGIAASAGTSAILTAAGVTAGTVIGSVVPVVGTIVGALIGGLLSGHFARAKGAKNENAALAQVLPAIIDDFKTVFAAASAGQISAQDALSALSAIQQNYWQSMAPFESGPGQGGGPGKCGTGNPTTKAEKDLDYNTHCGTGCTAGCCVGCNYVNVWVQQAMQIIQSGGGTLSVKAIGKNKYGFPGTAAWSVTYKAPPAGATVDALTSELTSSTVGGIPLWMLLVGGFLAMKAFS